jgi:hypothetical protein
MNSNNNRKRNETSHSQNRIGTIQTHEIKQIESSAENQAMVFTVRVFNFFLKMNSNNNRNKRNLHPKSIRNDSDVESKHKGGVEP